MKIVKKMGAAMFRLPEFVGGGKDDIMQTVKYIFGINIIVEKGENLPEEIIIGED